MAATVYRVLFFVLFAYIMCKFANLKHLVAVGARRRGSRSTTQRVDLTKDEV
jgi:hypothetical protein